MEQGQLNWVANFIWGIADDVLRDLYVRGKYRDPVSIQEPSRPSHPN
jgi:type I restriction enzyme M protein